MVPVDWKTVSVWRLGGLGGEGDGLFFFMSDYSVVM